MRHRYQLVLLTLIVLGLAGCERTRTITVNELRSKIGLASSLASESELFIGQIIVTIVGTVFLLLIFAAALAAIPLMTHGGQP
jgi:hypothetical protein